MTNRTIPCPDCGGDGNWRHGDDGVPGMIGIGCGACMGEGKILDRRSPTAAERAVERIKGRCIRETEDSCLMLPYDILDIIREEEGR